ncbi:anti-sigma regulatory factor [Christensenellaceae bacterium OttesenSCG-928-M15]|nr:anti-sigma regulatory factor [Christensenellaceae bacterium OttesenSCG-928-M15]
MALTLVQTYPVERGAFDTAGEASSKIKSTLKKLGISPAVIRDIAIAAYETELNLVIHSLGGDLVLEVQPEKIVLTSKDVGPGIADLKLALKEGYSTAPESVRDMGFGAGMGLPNIQRHCHEFHIESALGASTVITAIYFLNK